MSVASAPPSPWRTFGATSIAVFLVALDSTIGFAAFPALRIAFHDVSPGTLTWVLNAYTIVYAALLVPAGRLGDLMGRKRLFIAGVTLFTAASVLCGLAGSVEWLIAFRVLQAVGAALLTPTSLALVLAAFPANKRAIAVSVWGALGALASAIGPSVGAAIIDASSWHWAFFVNLPFGVFAVVRARRVLRESASPERGAALDYVGIGLIVAAMSLVTLAIVKAEPWGWTDIRTAMTGAAGLAVGLLFVRWAWHRPHAAVDLSLFREPTYVYANAATLLFSVAFTAMFLNFFTFMTGVWHYSLTLAGLAVTPGPLMVIPVAILSGRIAARVGHRPLLVLGGLVYACAGYWFYLRVTTQANYLGDWLPGMLAGGIGVGLVLPSLAGAAVAHLPADRFGVGSALNLAIRQLGSALGVALSISLVGMSAGLEGFRHVYLLLVAGGLATAVLSLPISTRPRTSAMPATAKA
jgi:EmrB/QacA subfamily drug resistance transporter